MLSCAAVQEIVPIDAASATPSAPASLSSSTLSGELEEQWARLVAQLVRGEGASEAEIEQLTAALLRGVVDAEDALHAAGVRAEQLGEAFVRMVQAERAKEAAQTSLNQQDGNGNSNGMRTANGHFDLD